MRQAVLAAALLWGAGCGPPQYIEPMPQPIEVPPDPPQVILRVPPDFTFRDYESGKQFYYRRYTVAVARGTVRDDRLGGDKSSITTIQEGEDLRLEVVTVVDLNAKEERLANDQERSHALTVLQTDWVSRGHHEMLAYHRDVWDLERRMRADLLDERIWYSERVLEDLKDERFTLEADLVSTRDTGYKAKEGHVEWLERQIRDRDGRIALQHAHLTMLKYERGLRDVRFRRSSYTSGVVEWVYVQDLVDKGLSPERLMSDVRYSVRPETWSGREARLRYSQGYLEITNVRATVDATRDYVEHLRTTYAK